MVCIAAGFPARSSAQSPAQRAEDQHRATEPRAGAPYLLRDGTVQIVSGLGMGDVIRQLDQLFTSTHPGVKFTLREGNNYSAMAALTFDKSAFAPLGCEYTRIGLGDNLKIASEPVAFRIAHASLTPGSAVPALGVIVNPANPIASLSLAQLTRIFAVGAPAGDLALWSQAGVAGPLAGRAIHPFGPLESDERESDDPQAGEFLSSGKMAGLNMNHSYIGLEHYAGVVSRVREDPAAIGIVALNLPLEGVKLLALRNGETGTTVAPSASAIEAGRYPLDRYVYIYLRAGKGMPLDEFGRQYIQTVLSSEGQRILAAQSSGYLPLNDAELAEERSRLDH